MIRSRLWQPETWVQPTEVHSFAEMLVAHAKPEKSIEQMQAMVERSTKESLY